MKNVLCILLSIMVLFSSSWLQAQKIKTFEFEGANGLVTVTQDIPAYFFGDYDSVLPDLHPGKMLLAKNNKIDSFHWWGETARTRKITWGVLVRDGKIAVQKVTPPNSAYRTYDRMKLIIRYEDESLGLVAWGLYRATSKKYGTRIVAGQYLKKSR